MLHLQHHALVRLIRPIHRLRHHPIESRALKPLEPIRRDASVPRRRSHMNRRSRPAQHLLQPPPPLRKRRLPQILLPHPKQIEKHHRSRTLLRQHLHPRSRRMNPQLQRIKIQPVLRRNHNLAIQHTALRQLRQQHLHHLRKIPIQRLPIPALHQNLVPIAKHNAPKPIPLRLKDPPVTRRNLRHPFRKHRQYRRTQRQAHSRIISPLRLASLTESHVSNRRTLLRKPSRLLKRIRHLQNAKIRLIPPHNLYPHR